MNKENKIGNFVNWLIIAIFVFGGISALKTEKEYVSENYTFRLISSSENEVFNDSLMSFARKSNIDLEIEYEDTLKIIKRLNNGDSFDGVWLSNSIWMYALDTKNVRVTDTKSTSINPVVFGIKKSVAESLGYVGRDVYTEELVNDISSSKFKFTMSNPATTNSGASAYLGILSTLAGNPEVLTNSMLDNEELKEKLKTFFTGLERSSGDEDFLEEAFVKGDYDAVFSYESSIININKQLENSNKEILYAIYPVDGVSISDSPIGYIDNKNENKKIIYNKIVDFLLSNDGQDLLASYGRRTWYGGVSDNVDKKVFNPNWGIDTTKYISPIKYPSTQVIQHALSVYQESLRKPIHVVFCLDYSGSMYGDGIEQLTDAMDYILTDRASLDLLQFTDKDIIDVVPFSSEVMDTWHSNNTGEMAEVLDKIKYTSPGGATALFPAAIKGLELLKDEDTNTYNTSIILMTDGAGNVGSYKELEKFYKDNNLSIPIYSIMFAAAEESQLQKMADLSNGKIFDGRENLVDAFMEVRGYN